MQKLFVNELLTMKLTYLCSKIFLAFYNHILQVLGFTAAEMKTRNAGLAGDEETMDWLFY